MYQTSWRYDPQFLRYRVWQTQIGIYGSFFTLLTSFPQKKKKKKKKKKKTWKIKFQKSDKKCWRYHHFTPCAPKTTIIWGAVPEIQSETDFFVILSPFLPFFLPCSPEKQTFGNMKKGTGHVTISHICTENHNNMMYGSWDMKGNRINCHFEPFLAPLLHWQPEKPKFWKNEESTLRYHHFTYVYHKWKSYDVWFLKYGVQQTEFLFILEHFLPYCPLTTQKIKILKKWKKSACRYHNFTKVYQKSWSYATLFLRYGMWHV